MSASELPGELWASVLVHVSVRDLLRVRLVSLRLCALSRLDTVRLRLLPALPSPRLTAPSPPPFPSPPPPRPPP